MTQAQATIELFRDFDNQAVFDECQQLNLREPTLNFVVEFGGHEARIAFDLSADDVTNLLVLPASEKRPVRWM